MRYPVRGPSGRKPDGLFVMWGPGGIVERRGRLNVIRREVVPAGG